ncbi:MAG: hypothetical protein Q4G52_03035 [Clostridia bacterium]|nr:hypothetical protein [Clostridia bacterium]
MKKMSIFLLCAMCLLLPAAGAAQGLPQFAQAVGEGLQEGLAAGSQLAAQSMDSDLTLALDMGAARIEEGQTLTLTVRAGNPRPVETAVTIELNLPERLSCAMDTAWEAVLPAAKLDAKTGELVPSETAFTREITLAPGGESETVTVGCEMAMGARFYRATSELSLCVSDIEVSATLTGTDAGRMQPGEAYGYRIEVVNSGLAAKTLPVELILPTGVALSGELPAGFAQAGSRIVGQVRAEAAQGDEASHAVIEIPAFIEEDALEGDADAVRLLTGTLRADGERIPLPRVQVCAPRISARLIPEKDSLEAGEEMELRILVVNAGLAEADVRLSCMLPEGLTPVKLATAKTAAKSAQSAEEKAKETDEKTAEQAQAVAKAQSDDVEPKQENNALVYAIHMDAASEADGGITANTRTITLRVRAGEPQNNLSERLLGTTLAWSADGGQTELGEAVATRIYRPMFMGITADEWSGIFWAGLLLIVTVCCLYAAVRVDSGKEEYSCD